MICINQCFAYFIQRFKEAAREIGRDNDEAKFNKKLADCAVIETLADHGHCETEHWDRGCVQELPDAALSLIEIYAKEYQTQRARTEILRLHRELVRRRGLRGAVWESS